MASVEPTEIPVPEGMDTAIFRQGQVAGAAHQLAVAATLADEVPPDPPGNRFAEGTPQAEAWQAGFDAGSAETPTEPA